MKIKLAKVRVTRPGACPPVERATVTTGGSVPRTGLEYLTEIQKRDNAEHDRNVRDYTAETLEAAFEDLRHRVATDRRDPEQRWVMNRRAALVRRAQSMKTGRAA